MSTTLGQKNISQNVSQKIAVAVGSPAVVGSGDAAIPIAVPAVIQARPGSGGTLLVEYRTDADGVWETWAGGTVSAATTYQLNGPVNALRFTAAVADGVVGVSQ